MGYINVFLSSPCKISVKNRQLVIQGEGVEKFPLEDLNCLLVESHECTVTSYALQAIASQNAAVFFCDAAHIPNSVLLPFNGYYRQLKTLNQQLKMPKPLQKHLWQQIIQQKIYNQAKVCALCNIAGTETLSELAKNVNSGDTNNSEAVAANAYFKLLFGKDFGRQKENGINACLNYGYAIVRGLISRTLMAYGFQPCLGLHHCNDFNNFNLSDDIIEPYRPVVDLIVYNSLDTIEDKLNTNMKRSLFGLVNSDVLINKQICALSYAIELTVQSLLASLIDGECNISLPEILPIKAHSYE